jgi:hypothetical protein
LEYKKFEDNLGKKSLSNHWDRCIDLSNNEEWIMILGDDDSYSSNLIESFYQLNDSVKSKTNIIRFAKQNIFIDKDEIVDVQYNPEYESASDSYYRRITGQTTSTLSEYAFKREVYEKYGFYNYQMAWQTDNRAWLEFAENKPIYSINSAVVSVICSSESITGSKAYSKEKRKANLDFYKFLIIEKLKLFKKHQAIRILHKYENEIKYKNKMTFRNYLFLLPYYIMNYEKKIFIQYLRKLFKSLFKIRVV